MAAALWFQRECRKRHCRKSIKVIKASKSAVKESSLQYGGQGYRDKLKTSSRHALTVSSALLLPPSLFCRPLCNHPWEQIAADLLKVKGVSSLLLVVYYSRYVEVPKLVTTTSENIVTILKPSYPKHVVSNNEPQFDSKEMKHFSAAYGFDHVTSSLHYLRANGETDRGVRTVKSLLEHAPDPHMALMSYLATPMLWCSLRPPKNPDWTASTDGRASGKKAAHA